MSWSDWPVVPEEQRKKKLFHNRKIGEEDLASLREKGWDPSDVRLLPNGNDGEKAESLKAYLEGLRWGSIINDQAIARYVEIEARVLGLTSGKGPEKTNKRERKEDLSLEEMMKIGGTTGHGTDSKKKWREKYFKKQM